MRVDVQSEITIHRPRDEVFAFAADPSNAPAWYVNIDAVRWITPPPLRSGSRIAFVARFLGRRLEYTYLIEVLAPPGRLAMRTEQGPFPMETTYELSALSSGDTRMRLRNRGEPRGFAGVAAPFIGFAMRRANRADLRRLKRLLETDRRASAPAVAEAAAARVTRTSTRRES